MDGRHPGSFSIETEVQMKVHRKSVQMYSIALGLMCLGTALIIAGCAPGSTPSAPTPANTTEQAGHLDHNAMLGSTLDSRKVADDNGNINKASDDKGYIDGWFNGETVQLYYTKVFFCEQPPSSGAPTGCEIGADPEVAPRPGPIPTIYAIATAGGIQPDLSTLSCPPGSVCLNHPAMIDVSRVRPGATNVPPVPHSHILSEHHAGCGDDVGVVQCARGAGLRHESVSAFRIAVGVVVQDLESHLAFEAGIPGAVDCTASTLAEECENLVRSEDLFRNRCSGLHRCYEVDSILERWPSTHPHLVRVRAYLHQRRDTPKVREAALPQASKELTNA
jgi:hypothetical protein